MDSQANDLQNYVDHLTTFVATLAPSGTILMVNAAAVTLSGIAQDEMVGKKVWEITPWQNSDMDPEQIRRYVETAASGVSVSFEFTYHTPTRCHMMIESILRPVLYEENKAPYIVMEGHDITERKQAENALRESEAHFRSIFEHAPVGIFQCTPEGRLITVNTTFAQSFGYQTPDEILADAPPRFTDKFLANPDLWPAIVRTVIGSQDFCRFESEHRRRDGSVFLANVYIRAVREGERVALLEGFEEDITERKDAERKLLEEKKLSERIINSFPGLFYMINRQGKMVWWNDYRDRVFSYTVDEHGYSDVLGYVLEEDRHLAVEALNQAFSGKEASVELRLPHKNGQVRVYYCTGVQVQIGDELYVVGVAVDITEHKRAEEEKRAFYRETIKSVTQGKLDLAGRSEVEEYLEDAEYSAAIDSPADVTETRSELEEYFSLAGFSGETLKLFLTGVGEAMTNAIKHTGSGTVYAGSEDCCMWAAVSDKGTGIAALTLPGATLRKGYSTKTSLGMGYAIMLGVSDRIALCTDSEGTTVVLIANATHPEHELSLEDLPDTWEQLPSI